ncbi:MAG: hypothetical protein AB8D78_15620 [Akkermansiaceae bacterium]
MEKHEWNERTEDGKRLYRASYHSRQWRIITSLKKDLEWQEIENPPEDIWRVLRDIVWKKYQRKRCPWERVESIDKILGDESTPH